MTSTHRAHTPGAWIGAGVMILGLSVSSACATGAVGRQTDIMQTSGVVSTSAAELRARVNDLADRIAGSIEETADRIRADATARDVQVRALALKVDAIPAIYAAAYRADPLAAAIDLWGLTFQVAHWTEDGAGRGVFGTQQPVAQAAARALVADADEALREVAVGPEAFERGRTRLESWARKHPIEYTVSSRASAAIVMAELQAEGRDAFASVGVVSVTVENVSERLNTYAAQLPKQARWQAELLLAEMTGEHDVEAALEDIRTIGAAARRVDGFVEALPDRIDKAGTSVIETAAAERRAAIEWVGAQRTLAIEFVTAQRLAFMEAIDLSLDAAVGTVREDLAKALEVVREERIAAMQDVDGTAIRTVDTAMSGLRDLVDYTLVRLAVLLLVLMVSATALGVVGYRLAGGRRSGAGT